MTKPVTCPKGHVNVRDDGVTQMSSAGGSIKINGKSFPLQAVNVIAHYYVCKTCKTNFKVIEQKVRR